MEILSESIIFVIALLVWPVYSLNQKVLLSIDIIDLHLQNASNRIAVGAVDAEILGHLWVMFRLSKKSRDLSCAQ